MYDWANSAFWTTVITAVFPILLDASRPAGLAADVAAFRFATITTIALVAVAVLSPVLGAMADSGGISKKMLVAFLALGASATAALALIGEGDWLLALALFMLGNIGVTGTIVFYDSLLPHVARPRRARSRVDGGFADRLSRRRPAARGQPGVDSVKPEWFGLPNAGAGMRLSFLSVAIWWVVFSIPLFRRVPEPPATAQGRGACRPRDRRRRSAHRRHASASCGATGTRS